jgi:hypothetical protein
MQRLIIPFIIIVLIASWLIAQEDDPADLLLSVSGRICALERVEGEPEATPEATAAATPEATPDPEANTPDWLPDLPTYTVGEDCDDLEPLLTVASNGTLWLALLTEDSDEWLPLDTLEDDPYPPQLDGRGRYFGCAIPDEGEQTCYVRVTLDDEDYLVAVPLWVGDAYYAPVPTATDAPDVQVTPEQQTSTQPQQNTGGIQPPPTEAACVPDGTWTCGAYEDYICAGNNEVVQHCLYLVDSCGNIDFDVPPPDCPVG